MAVRKLPNGKWCADVVLGKRLDGTPDRRRPEFKTKKEAEKEERRLLMLKEARRGRSYGGVLFSDFVNDYFWSQKPKLRTTTIKGYKRDLKLRLIPAFGNTPIEEIGRYDIQKMIDSCATKKVATNARETLSSILSLAAEMDVIDKNPASYHYQYPDASEYIPDRFGEWLTTWDEIVEVLDYLAEHHVNEAVHRITLLGLTFGLRKGEILALQSEDVHIKERYISIKETYTQGEGAPEFNDPKTPKGFRDIPIMDIALPWLEAWSKEGGYIVKNRFGEAMKPPAARKAVWRVFDSGTFDDGRPLPKITPFSMRHSFATACAQAGVPDYKLQAWMGHRDISTTKQYYIKTKIKDLTKDADFISKLIKGDIP